MQQINRQQDDANTYYCRDCAEWAFGIWRGWPPTEAARPNECLPDLPMIIDGKCGRCEGQRALSPQHIFYRNYHGPHSTGLPDYFYLEVSEDAPIKNIPPLGGLGPPYTLEGVGRISLEALARIKKL